jgi:hypothetical protein
MSTWNPKQQFKQLTINYLLVLQLRVGSSDVIVAYFIVSGSDGRHGYYSPYRFVENTPVAVAHVLDAMDYGDEALLGGTPGKLSYSAKILVESGPLKISSSSPITVDALHGTGKLGFVVVQQPGLVHNVFLRLHIDIDAKAGRFEEFTLPMFVPNFPSNIAAAAHPVPGNYSQLAGVIFNNHYEPYTLVQRVAQLYLAGPPRWHLFDISRFVTPPISTS